MPLSHQRESKPPIMWKTSAQGSVFPMSLSSVRFSSQRLTSLANTTDNTWSYSSLPSRPGRIPGSSQSFLFTTSVWWHLIHENTPRLYLISCPVISSILFTYTVVSVWALNGVATSSPHEPTMEVSLPRVFSPWHWDLLHLGHLRFGSFTSIRNNQLKRSLDSIDQLCDYKKVF